MQPFLHHKYREYYVIVLERPGAFSRPFTKQPYPCLLWDTCGGWTEQERTALAEALIESDCRYVVCGGRDCEQWHDDVDCTFIASARSEAERDACFVMTTWHTDEPPEEVAFFFAFNTNFEEHDFSRFLILQLGNDPMATEALQSAVVRHVTDGELHEESSDSAG